MAKFITVTSEEGKTIGLNIDQIVSYAKHTDSMTWVVLAHAAPLLVKITAQELHEKLLRRE